MNRRSVLRFLGLAPVAAPLTSGGWLAGVKGHALLGEATSEEIMPLGVPARHVVTVEMGQASLQRLDELKRDIERFRCEVVGEPARADWFFPEDVSLIPRERAAT